jgi:adenylate cyclase
MHVPEPPKADEVEIEFWDTIKHSTSALEYRVYLERYPNGAFAPLALARIDNLEHGHIAVAAAAPVATVDPMTIELTFWETVKESTNPEMYEAYLEKYPAGEFATLAKTKLTELSAEERSEEHDREPSRWNGQ